MRKYIDYFIGIFLVASSIFYIPGQNFHDSQKVLFKGFVFSALIISLYIKPIRDLRDKWINSFLVVAFLSFLFNPTSRVVGISSLVDITLAVILFYLLLNYISDTNIVYSSMIAIIVINAVMILFQFLKIDPLCLNDVRKQNTHIVGLFGHPMNLGVYMGTILPYLIYKNKGLAILAGILLLSCGGFNIVDKSWGAMLSAVVGVILYFFLTNKKIFKRVVISMMIAGILTLAYMSFTLPQDMKETLIKKITLRVYTQWPLFKVALSNPWFGYGPGTFRHIVPQVKEIDTGWLGGLDVTWNDYLGCALEIGFISILIVFGIFRDTFRKFLRSDSPEVIALFCSLATIPIGIFFHSYMNYINIGVLCMALYVIFQIKTEEEGI